MNQTTVEPAKQVQLLTGSSRRIPPLAWRMSLRLMGWIGIVGSIAGIIFLMLGKDDPLNPFPIARAGRAVEAVIPLVIGLQAAFALSPDDEPALETLLACPRPINWLLLERLSIILLVQFGIAIVATALILPMIGEQDVIGAVARWLPPSLFFCGVGVYTTIRSRQPAFSIAIIGVIWFIFSFMGVLLLPGRPTFWPLNIVQPYLWVIHPYLQPGQMSNSEYWFNRLMVAVVGVGLLLLTLWNLCEMKNVYCSVGEDQNNGLGVVNEYHDDVAVGRHDPLRVSDALASSGVGGCTLAIAVMILFEMLVLSDSLQASGGLDPEDDPPRHFRDDYFFDLGSYWCEFGCDFTGHGCRYHSVGSPIWRP